jgi:hypothetical protein
MLLFYNTNQQGVIMAVWKVISHETPLGWDEVSEFEYVQRTEAIFTTRHEAFQYADRENKISERFGDLEFRRVVKG